MKFRILTVLLAAALLLGGLSGCADSGLRPHETPEQSENPTPEPTPEDESSGTKDYTYAFEKYEPDEVVMTINGLPVCWDEYFYALYSMVGQIELYFGDVTDWDAVSAVDETMTTREFVEGDVMTNLRSMKAIESKAAEIGVVLSQEDIDQIEATLEEEVEARGGEEYFDKYLDIYYLNMPLYRKIKEISQIYLNCFNELYGENGEKCSDEETLDYIEEQGIIGSKHILILKTGEDDEQKLALAEELLAKLDEAENLDETFDELMNEYSEDTGLATAPFGYFFAESESIYPEYRQAMTDLEVGQYSGIVESTSGYHIILRIPAEPESIVYYTTEEDKQTLRLITAFTNFDALVSSWTEEAEVVFTEKFAGVTYEDIFNK